jgi:hypothetical protein
LNIVIDNSEGHPPVAHPQTPGGRIVPLKLSHVTFAGLGKSGDCAIDSKSNSAFEAT